MKKVIKGFAIFFTVIFAITLKISLILFGLIYLFLFGSERDYHIKTEYGDSFTVTHDTFYDPFWYISYDGSGSYDYICYFDSKRDIQPVCDSEYFRCYSLKNEKEDAYILKIKKYDEFFVLCNLYNTEDTKFYFKYNSSANKAKSEFLCDSNLMEIILPFYDELYHDEMITVAEKMTAGDFDDLDKYGLTEEMINDSENLEEKIAVMEDYLKKSK